MAVDAPKGLEGVQDVISRSDKAEAVAVVLIPWDPDSDEHVERMRQQRIACGWKEEMVLSWRQLQRDGKMGIHWITLSPSHPATSLRIEAHTTAFPQHSLPLQDSCKTILSRLHTPESASSTFIPVGHISLDTWTSDSTHGCSPTNGVYSLSTFWVSKPLQSSGLGRLAMQMCEQMAKDAFGAKAITLDTLANEEQTADSPRRIALGRPIPKIRVQDWYERQGYVPYAKKKDQYFDVDANGKQWPAMAVFLRKELV